MTAQILNLDLVVVQPLVALIIGILDPAGATLSQFFRGDLSDSDRRVGPLAAPDRTLAHPFPFPISMETNRADPKTNFRGF